MVPSGVSDVLHYSVQSRVLCHLGTDVNHNNLPSHLERS